MPNRLKDQVPAQRASAPPKFVGGWRTSSVGVLMSGGVESAAMLTEALLQYERVYPIYVRKGLKWEEVELSCLKVFLRSCRSDGLADLTVLDMPMKEIYGAHWSMTSRRTPGFTAPDSAVYLPGRNILLLSLSALLCWAQKIPVLWIGILKGNPFQDARRTFLKEMEHLLGKTLQFSLRIEAPFREMSKKQVIARYPGIPWEKTFSCLRPVGTKHCGRCQKCAERQAGFKSAGVSDPTRYAR